MAEQVFLLNQTELDQSVSSVVRKAVKEVFEEMGLAGSKDEILRVSNLCQMLGVSRQTIVTWSDKGLLKRHYIADSVFYLRSEVLAAMTDKRLK